MKRLLILGARRCSARSPTASASADDHVKVAIGQRGNWDTAIIHLGTKAGIFKKHGITLEMLYTSGGGETHAAGASPARSISASAVGTIGVHGAYAKGAPVRIIGAQATGAADLLVREGGLRHR